MSFGSLRQNWHRSIPLIVEDDMIRTFEFEIALSFAGEDRVYVSKVATLLKQLGITVFYDEFEEEKLWGTNVYDYLSDIYQNKARFTIMFISENYARKLWTNHERQAMQARAFQEHREYILPARFDETPIAGLLPTVGYISLEKRTPQEFVEVIQRKLRSTSSAIESESLPRAASSLASLRLVEAPGLTEPGKRAASKLRSLKPKPNVIYIDGNSNVVGDGNTIVSGPLPRPRVVTITKPGIEHITVEQRAELKALVSEIVTLSTVLKKKARTHAGLWSALNRAMEVPKYDLIPLHKFDAAKAFLMRERAILSGMKSAPKKVDGWRTSAIGSIQARARERPTGTERRKSYMLKNFGVDTMTECSDEQIEQIRKHVFGWK